jgi:hypothetical protein
MTRTLDDDVYLPGPNRENGQGGFFARIFCRDDEKPWKYFFKQLIITAKPLTGKIEWDNGDPLVHEQSFISGGTTYLQAEEANKNQNVPFNSVVWMRPGPHWDDGQGMPHVEYRFNYDAAIWGIITGQGKESLSSDKGNGEYSWREVIRDETQIKPDWVYAPEGRSSNPQIASGNTLNVQYPAREINGANVPSGTIVQLFPSVPDGIYAWTELDACTGINSQEWLFTYTPKSNELMPFELYDDLKTGDHAECYIRELQDNGLYKTNKTDQYTLVDYQNIVRCFSYGLNHYQPINSNPGAFGWCQQIGDYLGVISIESVAHTIYGSLTETLETTSDTITVGSLTAPSGQLPGTDTIEANNIHKFAGDNGAIITLTLWKIVNGEPQYAITQVDCEV